jgi:hypothetical protein
MGHAASQGRREFSLLSYLLDYNKLHFLGLIHNFLLRYIFPEILRLKLNIYQRGTIQGIIHDL